MRVYTLSTNNGIPCFNVGRVVVDGDPFDAQVGNFAYPVTYPACPGQDDRPTPAEAAYQAWRTLVHLPPPNFTTTPNTFITGLPTYLTTTGPTTIDRTYNVFGYTVRLHITSTYTITWNDPHPDPTQPDGTNTTTFTTGATGHPTGTIHHTYINTGTTTTQLDQHWQAAWTAADDSGIIGDRLRTTTTTTHPIQQIQATITG